MEYSTITKLNPVERFRVRRGKLDKAYKSYTQRTGSNFTTFTLLVQHMEEKKNFCPVCHGPIGEETHYSSGSPTVCSKVCLHSIALCWPVKTKFDPNDHVLCKACNIIGCKEPCSNF